MTLSVVVLLVIPYNALAFVATIILIIVASSTCSS